LQVNLENSRRLRRARRKLAQPDDFEWLHDSEDGDRDGDET
jgi:hypothetical protein